MTTRNEPRIIDLLNIFQGFFKEITFFRFALFPELFRTDTRRKKAPHFRDVGLLVLKEMN